MDSGSRPQSRVLWSFWLACGLAATGAITPLVLAAGDFGRNSGVAIPFGIAAVAMAVNALTYQRGRSLATAMYVVAWLAVVYGILRMIAVPLQEAVVGSCPAPASDCASGFTHPFAGSESLAIGVGVVAGALALQVGYFGLRALYRSTRQQQQHAAYASPPPQRVIAPISAASPAQSRLEAPVVPESATAELATAEPAAVERAGVEPEAADTASPAPPDRKPRTRRPPKRAAEPAPEPEAAELPAHAEAAELPAHTESAELPAHAEQAELPTHRDPAELPPHPGTASST